MNIVTKVKLGSSKDLFQRFGPNMYIFYLKTTDNEEACQQIIFYLSGCLGVPPARITFLKQDQNKNWVFEIKN